MDDPKPPANRARGTSATGAHTLGAGAAGAYAMGALALGVVVFGAFAVGRLSIGRARIGSLEIDELTVRRLRILRELGHAEVPVSVVRLTDAQEKALNVVLNNHEAQGRYDPGKLADLLEELGDLPEGRYTGFTAADLKALRFEPAE